MTYTSDMRTLFLERFLVEPIPSSEGRCEYDDERQYAVTPSGEPAVVAFGGSETRTITEARGESSDADEDPDLKTLTFVRDEGADVGSAHLATRTETRIQDESPDFDHASPRTETMTKIRAEQPDYQLAAGTMTKTGIQYPRD